jgi:peptidoglycan/xylan/chitin deacetylase (PgdA/CDA1 family)
VRARSAHSRIERSARAWRAVRDGAGATATLGPESGSFERGLRFRHPWHVRAARLAFAGLLGRLPYGVYRPLMDVVKPLLRSARGESVIGLEPGPLTRSLAPDSAEGTSGSVTVCLTHDVDTAGCFESLERVLEIEEGLGVRSTCNFLTAGPYRVSQSGLDDLERRGFEVGLHGDTHDLAFGFRAEAEIRRRLGACLDRLGRRVRGYRAPALCVSETLLGVLDDLGFRHDSSIRLRCFYDSGIEECVPYVYPGTSLWELPLAIQDDGLFRDQKLSAPDAVLRVKRVLELTRPVGGLVVINTHPVILRERHDFYRQLLSELSSHDWVRLTTAGELAQRLDDAIEVEAPE